MKPKNHEYLEPVMNTSRSVSDFQRARKIENDALPSHEWTLKLAAIRSSGLIEERRALKWEE